MALPIDEVLRIAALARLELAPDEVRRFADQLGEVVEFIDRMGSEKPGSAATPVTAVHEAADEPRGGLSLEAFLANTPEHQGPFLVVPRIFETESAPEGARRDV